LIQDQTKMTNAERLTDCTSKLISLLEGEQDGTSEKIRQSFSHMTTLTQTDTHDTDPRTQEGEGHPRPHGAGAGPPSKPASSGTWLAAVQSLSPGPAT